MRQRVALFKDQRYDAAAVAAARLSAMTDDDDEDDVPEVRCPTSAKVAVSPSAFRFPLCRLEGLGSSLSARLQFLHH